jgi:hypothetical protein
LVITEFSNSRQVAGEADHGRHRAALHPDERLCGFKRCVDMLRFL